MMVGSNGRDKAFVGRNKALRSYGIGPSHEASSS